MVINQKVTGKASSMPAGIGIGTVASIGITLLFSLITAWLMDKEMLPENTIGYCAIVTLLCASAAGSGIASSMIKRRRLLMCGISGIVYYLCLICATALFFGGEYTGMGVTALAVLGGCIGVGVLGTGRKRRSVPIKKLRHIR